MSINDGPSPEMRRFARPELDQPLSAADAERLLAGQGASPDAPKDQQALAMMLRYAAGPAQKEELAGQVSAIAAFALVKGQETRRAEGPVRAAAAPPGWSGGRVAVVDANPAPAARRRVRERGGRDSAVGNGRGKRPPGACAETGARHLRRPRASARRSFRHCDTRCTARDASPGDSRRDPEKPANSASPHGNGKAAGKTRGRPSRRSRPRTAWPRGTPRHPVTAKARGGDLESFAAQARGGSQMRAVRRSTLPVASQVPGPARSRFRSPLCGGR